MDLQNKQDQPPDVDEYAEEGYLVDDNGDDNCNDNTDDESMDEDDSKSHSNNDEDMDDDQLNNNSTPNNPSGQNNIDSLTSNTPNTNPTSNGLVFDDELQDQMDQLRPLDSCENKGDFMLCDMGSALPFKSDSFDGVISVSAIQWLCQVQDNQSNQFKRIKCFFENLQRVMKKGARAVFQF